MTHKKWLGRYIHEVHDELGNTLYAVATYDPDSGTYTRLLTKKQLAKTYVWEIEWFNPLRCEHYTTYEQAARRVKYVLKEQ